MNKLRQRGYANQSSSLKGRLVIGVIIAIVSLIAYYSHTVVNPVTGEKQHISISPQQEIGLGLQAAPEMAQQFCGFDDDSQDGALVRQVGTRVSSGSDAKGAPYRYEYHLLRDPDTINAFALPGGQIF